MLNLNRLDLERLTHGAKTGFACILGLIAMRFIQASGNQWIVISILVVMCAQPRVGSVLQKSSMRFFGTLAGSLLAAAGLYCFGPSPVMITSLVIFSGILFSYIATGETRFSDSGTLGAVTVTLILLNPDPTVATALQRFLEITLGLVIAGVISQFILPLHANLQLNYAKAKTLRDIQRYYAEMFVDTTATVSAEEEHTLDEFIVKAIAKQRDLAKEAQRERLMKPFNAEQFNQFLRAEKDLFRSIIGLRYASDQLGSEGIALQALPTIRAFHQNILASLECLSLLFENKPSPIFQVPEIRTFKEACEQFDKGDPMYRNGLVFCAEMLITQLQALHAVI